MSLKLAMFRLHVPLLCEEASWGGAGIKILLSVDYRLDLYHTPGSVVVAG